MKLTSTILTTTLLLTASTGAARCQTTEPAAHNPAAQAGATNEKNGHAAAGARMVKLPFIEELDKIDDVNPYVIKSIIVEGNKLISRSQIKAEIKTKPGDFYHRKDMEADLIRVYQLGYFDGQTMHVSAETTAAGMVINIKLKENPFLKHVTFEGNHIVPTDKMEELFKDQLQKPRSSTRLAKSMKAIEEMYKSQGYLLVRTYLGKEEKEGTLPIIIKEGNLKEIKITGLPEDQKKIVQESLTLRVGEPYNEKQLTNDLNAAIQSGKVVRLQRQVDKSKGGGYTLTISPLPAAKEKITRTATAEPPTKGASTDPQAKPPSAEQPTKTAASTGPQAKSPSADQPTKTAASTGPQAKSPSAEQPTKTAAADQRTNSATTEQPTKTATESVVDEDKTKSALPVLDRHIKSPMHKDIR